MREASVNGKEGRGIAKRYLTLLSGRMPNGVMSVDAPLHINLRQGESVMSGCIMMGSLQRVVSVC